MTQEDKSLLLQDLCARLPYGVKCFAEDSEYGDVGVMYSVDPFEKVDPNIYIQYYKGNVMSFFTSEVKPYLRSMSSMTEEEKHYIDNRWGADNYGDITTYSSYEGGISVVELADIIGFQDWLNKNMFDYKGLIPKGLAIEAPEGMYEEEQQ